MTPDMGAPRTRSAEIHLRALRPQSRADPASCTHSLCLSLDSVREEETWLTHKQGESRLQCSATGLERKKTDDKPHTRSQLGLRCRDPLH